MKNKITFALLFVLLVLVIALGSVFYNRFSDDYTDNDELGVVEKNTEKVTDKQDEKVQENAEESTESENENVAPDVEFFDAFENSFMLSDFFDKPIVFNFWATWCGACKSHMPGFDNLYEKYKDDVNFIMLNVSDERKTAEAFLEDNGYDFPIYYDDSNICSYVYGASSIPLTFVMKKGGEVYGYQIGALSEEALESAIMTVLEEE